MHFKLIKPQNYKDIDLKYFLTHFIVKCENIYEFNGCLSANSFLQIAIEKIFEFEDSNIDFETCSETNLFLDEISQGKISKEFLMRFTKFYSFYNTKSNLILDMKNLKNDFKHEINQVNAFNKASSQECGELIIKYNKALFDKLNVAEANNILKNSENLYFALVDTPLSNELNEFLDTTLTSINLVRAQKFNINPLKIFENIDKITIENFNDCTFKLIEPTYKNLKDIDLYSPFINIYFNNNLYLPYQTEFKFL